MSKFRVYQSNFTGKDVSWDTDSAYPFVADIEPYDRQIGSNLVSPRFQEPIITQPLDKKSFDEDSLPENYLLFVYSRPYPININFRQNGNVVQNFNSNIPNLQFLEDILKKGSAFKKISSIEELRYINKNNPTELEISFYNFLKSNYKSWRNFILQSNTYNLSNSKKTLELDKYKENYIRKIRQSINSIFPYSDLENLSTKYKFNLLGGFIKNSSSDSFDFNLINNTLSPNIHFNKYWNRKPNILNFYNQFQYKKIENFSNIVFNNLQPDVINYSNPNLIKIIETTLNASTGDYTTTYEYLYDKNKPNRDGNKTILNINNINCVFRNSIGTLKYIVSKDIIIFSPTNKILKNCSITNYDINTKKFIINYEGNSHENKKIVNINESSIGKSGTIYISDNYSLYFYDN